MLKYAEMLEDESSISCTEKRCCSNEYLQSNPCRVLPNCLSLSKLEECSREGKQEGRLFKMVENTWRDGGSH